jgi:hypothetical protein
MSVDHLQASDLIIGQSVPKSTHGRRPLAFTKRDLARAIAGHMQAGLSVQRVEIDKNGRIIIVTGQAEATNLAPQSAENEWDTL